AESTGNRWSLLVAGRCAGLVALAAGSAEEAVSILEAALAVSAASELRLEWLRTRLALGTALRHANQRRTARGVLDDVVAQFEEMGAVIWSARARDELAAIGGRVASAGPALTTMERRVADLAAAGQTNSEIASALYLSVRTVETHLSAAYRKLNVR